MPPRLALCWSGLSAWSASSVYSCSAALKCRNEATMSVLARTQAAAVQEARPTWWERNSQQVFIYVCFGIFLLVIGLPFYYIFVSSITPKNELFQIPPSYFPSTPTLQNYVNMADSIPFLTYLRNSAIFAVGSSLASVIAGGFAAYALARIHFRGSNIVYMALILSVA